MTEKERMINTLFSGKEGRTCVNVKFFVGDDRNVTEEEFCREINSALDQRGMGLSEAKTTVDGNIQTVALDKFLGA